MSLSNYAVKNTIIQINLKLIEDLGESETPVKLTAFDPVRGIKRGMGRSALIWERMNGGRKLTLAVMPGSPTSGFLSGLYESGAIVSFTETVVGTGEVIACDEGVCVDIEDIDRAGVSISDDVYAFEFNTWYQKMGAA